MNLFASFILRALAVLGKDIILYNSYSKRPDNEKQWVSYVAEVCPSAWWVCAGNRRAGRWGWRGEQEGKGVSKASWLDRRHPT